MKNSLLGERPTLPGKTRIPAGFIALLFAISAEGQIPVGSGGAGPLTFNTTPLVAEFATAVLNGTAPTYSSPAGLDAGVQTLNANNITRRLPADGTVPPVSFSGGFRHNTTGMYLQSRPTTDNTNAASVLMARLENTSGERIASFGLSYDFNFFNFNNGEVPGFRVFYSLSGSPGSWQLIPALSGLEAMGQHSANVAVATWAPGAILYLLWADDNADSITDPSYTIDNLVVTSVITDTVAATCVGITNQPSSLTLAERATAEFNVGATGTPQRIQWFRNGAMIPGEDRPRYTIASVFYSNDHGAQFHAIVSNSICVVTSAVATLTVLPDTVPPTVISAVGDVALDTVRVTFSEPIFNTGNMEAQFIVFPRGADFQGGEELLTIAYALTNGNRTVILTVSPARQFGSNYSLYVTQISDVSSARNMIQPDPSFFPISSMVELIGFNANNEWKYSIGHTIASNLHGTGWEQPDYNDSAWLSGPAGLGHDSGQPNGVPIRTELPYATDAATGLNVTTYFRRRFYFPSATTGATLSLRDVVEDGAVYYLNGQEIFRNRMPGGTVTFGTTTPSASEPQAISGPFDVPVTNLRPGTNVLAVEVHQNGLESSDLEFAAELTANIPMFEPVTGPKLNLSRSPVTGVISIAWPGGGVLQQALFLQTAGTNWNDVPGNPNPYQFTPGPGQRFFRVRP